jgi:hypothetical protein
MMTSNEPTNWEIGCSHNCDCLGFGHGNLEITNSADETLTVTSRTRAGKNGKVIICPICATAIPVYHFAWIALVCPDCKSQVSKTNWLISTRQGV